MYPPWHLRDANAALAFYGSSSRFGLSSTVAKERLKEGLNLLPQPPARSQLQILLNQFKSLPVLLLGVSAALSLITGGASEALTIAAVLALNGGIGFATERRAESTITSLSELIDDIVPVLRDGKLMHIDAAHIAVGDILVLSPGIHIAADARLVQVNGLTIDESTLTGESMPVAKRSEALTDPAALADRINMVYRGTAVVTGSGLALAAGTGTRTEIGAIHSLMAQTEHPKTPIQTHLDQLGNQLVKASSAICIGVFAIGLLRGYDLLRMFKVAISLAIAAVPEGLPAVATTSLARGIRLMRERNVLIRCLQAVETIGAIQTICLDKTGTLTMNRMSAVEVQAGLQHFEAHAGRLHIEGEAVPDLSNPELLRLLQICALCSETEFRHDDPASSANGSPTERALIELALAAGVPVAELRRTHTLLMTELRAQGRNYMKTVHALPGSQAQLVAIKGSPVEVLGLCRHYQSEGVRMPLDEQARERIMQQNEQMAKKRLRVLGFAYAESHPARIDNPELIWVGLVGLADPLRTGVKKLIDSFHCAGIRTTMVTGDQSATALSIGKTLGLNNGSELRILNAEHLEQLSPEVLHEQAQHVDIFARVSPSHKLQIVQALRGDGHVIAMTGDGINDGPALQAADIGIAMGHGGTDLARSAADIILKDDKLETLLEAISQGRTISDNIRKSLHFLISSNLSEILVVLGGVTLAADAPLTPMQLLWLNLLTDVLPAIALTAEAPEEDVMQRPPRDAARPLIGKDELLRYAREGGALAGGSLAAYLYGAVRYGRGARAGAISFNTLILGQLLHAMSCRSELHHIWPANGNGRNRQLDWAVTGSVLLQLLANLIPGLRRLLGTGPMNIADIAVTLAGAGVPLLVNETIKSSRLQQNAIDLQQRADYRNSGRWY